MEGAKPIYINPPTARVLGKLKKGHKCRICPAMEGKGMELIIHPERYNSVTKSFSKGRGVHYQMSPEEIAHNHGKGIFDSIKKGAKAIGKAGKQVAKIAEPVAKPLAKALIPVAKKEANKLIDLGVKNSGTLGASALSAAAVASGNPELVPVANVVGRAGGKALGKQAGKMAKKQVNTFDPYGQFKAKEPRSRAVQSADLQLLNDYTGSNMGHIENANMGSAEANLSLAQLEDMIARKRSSMGLVAQNLYDFRGGVALAPYTDAVPPSYSMLGQGLYAGGSGLYAGVRGGAIRTQRPRREMSSIGIHGNLLGSHMPPALRSQPFSANFQFGSRLPPAYARFAQSGQGLY